MTLIILSYFDAATLIFFDRILPVPFYSYICEKIISSNYGRSILRYVASDNR